MSDGLNFVVVDEVEVESSHSRTSNRCSFDKLRARPVGSDLDYCIRVRTPAPTQRRAKRRSIANAQQGGTRGGAFVGEHGSWDRPRFNRSFSCRSAAGVRGGQTRGGSPG